MVNAVFGTMMNDTTEEYDERFEKRRKTPLGSISERGKERGTLGSNQFWLRTFQIIFELQIQT